MGSKQKLILTLLGLFLIFFSSMIVITVIHFRDFGIKSAEKRAMITAETVKGGLTAHMVNGIMHKRSYFLKQIEDIDNVSALWISRSPTVIKQFGEGLNNEITRDEMDKIIYVATEDGHVDAQEQVLLDQLQELVENKTVKIIP